MKRSLHLLQRLRRIREERAASKLRTAQAHLRQEQDTLTALQSDAQRVLAMPLVTGAHAQEIAGHVSRLHAQAKQQGERVMRAERDLKTRRSLLQLRSRELSSLERIQEEMAAREAEEARKKEAKELNEIATRIYLKKAA